MILSRRHTYINMGYLNSRGRVGHENDDFLVG
jgi:hypothetical protein